MIAHIEGNIVHKSPAFVVLDCGGVGYGIHISLHTYENLPDSPRLKLHTHLVIKEDSHTLYGFSAEDEKQLFIQLISVSGVGPNTARLMLSSLQPGQIREAITTGNWALIKTVKGIGEKTAQKVVIDLKNKVGKSDSSYSLSIGNKNSAFDEALAALMMLGFSKTEAEKGLLKTSQQYPASSTEELVKLTLKIL